MDEDSPLDQRIVELAFSANHEAASQMSQPVIGNAGFEELKGILQKVSKKQIREFLESRCKETDGNPCELIKALFIGSLTYTVRSPRRK
jgi:hypothetical protein